jgi:hypothetical protein
MITGDILIRAGCLDIAGGFRDELTVAEDREMGVASFLLVNLYASKHCFPTRK